MSNITENTIVIRTSDKDEFERDWKSFEADFGLSNKKQVFADEDIQVYVFDCNGDNPWYLLTDVLVPIINEVKYPGENTLTEALSLKDNKMHSSRFHCMYHLKRMFPNKDFRDLQTKIKYTF